MNYIKIKEPRWHDRTVLIAGWKIGNTNQIVIDNHNFNDYYYMSGEKIRSYPTHIMKTKTGADATMYVVPLDDMVKATDLIVEEL